MFCGKAFGCGDGRDPLPSALHPKCTRNFSTVPSRTLMTEALGIAFTYDRAVYDCLYVALAVRSKSQMITADERLANALAAYLPVKWLGAL